MTSVGAEVVELAERTGATVWVSPLSARCSFPEVHPAFAGFLTPAAGTTREQLAPHDVVVGARRARVHISRALRGRRHRRAARTVPTHRRPDDGGVSRPSVPRSSRRSASASPSLLADCRQSDREPAGRRPAHATAGDPISGASCCRSQRGDARGRHDRRGGAVAPQRDARLPPHPAQSTASTAGASGGLGWALPAAVGMAPRRSFGGASCACSATGRASTRSRRSGRRPSTRSRSASSSSTTAAYIALKALGPRDGHRDASRRQPARHRL